MSSDLNVASKIARGLRGYAQNVRAFSRNASLYLVSTVISSAAFGVFRLLFNFYVLSLGYDEALVGNLVTTSSLTALIAAVPMGYLADILGRKISLIGGGLLTVTAITGMLVFPAPATFIAMNVLMRLGRSIAGVTMGQFLMENGGEKERTYLFSFSSGLSMAASSVGNWIGGLLPTWMAGLAGGDATSPEAYRLSLMVVVVTASLSGIPLLVMVIRTVNASERSRLATFTCFYHAQSLLGQVGLLMLCPSLGSWVILSSV